MNVAAIAIARRRHAAYDVAADYSERDGEREREKSTDAMTKYTEEGTLCEILCGLRLLYDNVYINVDMVELYSIEWEFLNTIMVL